MKKIFVNLLVLFIAVITLSATTCKNDVDGDGILDLPPLKDQFSDYFMIGNIYNAEINNWAILGHHYNAVTAENIMKPGYLSQSKGSYSFSTANSFVNKAKENGFQVIGHTVLWHSQNAAWMTAANCDLETLKSYVTAIVGNFAGKIYSWDVLNEAFPDGGYSASSDWKEVIRRYNPWYASIGSDFVYEGFLAARLADPNAILYYNDYNTDVPAKATMIRNMVRDVNNRYLASSDKPAGEDTNRLLIEGIGMQEHHNTGISADRVRATLKMFNEMTFEGSNKKIIVSVTELDVLSQTWQQFDGKAPVTKEGLETQAKLYGEYFKLYLEYHDIIERVSFWGVTDNQSWRSAAQPLIFDSKGKAKEAYYSIIEALEKFKS